MTHTDTSSKLVELEKWDVHGVLRDGAAEDFGSIEAKFGILAERLRMIESSLQTNEQPTEYDFDRLQESIAIAKEGEATALRLFKKLNYTVTTKREI
jgi:hypothetical protein